MRKFAISDVHGCRNTFEELLQQIGLTKNEELYLLGDYIDRGPDSKGVIDFIWQLREDGYQVHCLRGNHEEMMLGSMIDKSWRDNWIGYNGGAETITSFGVQSWREIPEQYLIFLLELDYFFEVDEYILVHAGLDFEEDDPFGQRHSLIWIRDWYENIDYDWLGDRIIVHGHTPQPSMFTKSMLKDIDHLQVIDIDNGCVFPHSKLNTLCAFELTERKLFFQKNIESRG